MTTMGEIMEAEVAARRQRMDNARLLRLIDAGASAEDIELGARVIAAGTKDFSEYDRALRDEAVGKLFARGVLRFEAANP